MQNNQIGYYSSIEKNIIRNYFDLPLLQQLYQQKREPLSYFGLPGAKADDIRAWKDFIGEIGAVDKNLQNLQMLERVLEAQFADIRFKTHFGDMDEIILANRGKPRNIGGERYQPTVGNIYKDLTERRVWCFDVVYLDYFGTFLPAQGGSSRARKRTAALNKLFDRDRVDAWQPWILLITVEARRYGNSEQRILTSFLRDSCIDASDETREALNFLISEASNPQVRRARLIHGATALLVAGASISGGVEVQPRGTVLYRGANDASMVHMAFEFQPNRRFLEGTSPRLGLLNAPMLKPKDPAEFPWLELLPCQGPGTTRESAESCLNFLEGSALSEVINPLS